MNRSDLIKRVADQLFLDHEEAAIFIRVWEEEVEKALIEEGEVGLMGFGVFTLWKQPARPGRNPRKNVACMIAPRNSVKFKPGKLLLEHLNPREEEPDENV